MLTNGYKGVHLFKWTLRLSRLIATEALVLLCFTGFSPLVGAASVYESYETSIDYTIFRLASERNDPSAQYLVGRNYLKGKSVQQDIAKAIKWFERSASQNYARAEYQLGKMYLYGEEVKADREKAFHFLDRAAQRNDLDAQFELANYYLQDNPAAEQYAQAVKWLRQAVAREHVRAHYILGKLEYEGKGTPANPAKAIELLSLAAENGLLEASRYLDTVKASNSHLASDTATAVPAQQTANTSSPDSAKPRPAASIAGALQLRIEPQVDANDYYRMGLDALTGEGNKRQVDKAAEYFQKAAEMNHGKAQYQLAKLYQQGIGVKQDDNLHKLWLEKAARAGVNSAKRDLNASKKDAEIPSPGQAQSALTLTLTNEKGSSANELYIKGLNYLTGTDVPKDPVKAADLFLKAADLNHPRSQYQLGLMYVDGIGLERDTDEARQWLSKAADAGLADARDVLNNLQPRNTSDVETVSDVKTVTVATAADTIVQSTKQITKEPLLTPQSPAQQEPAARARASQAPILSELERQADSNDPAAQYTLGLNYLLGRNNYDKNTQQGLHWLTKAADNQYTEAQIELGNLYFRGIEVERDYEQAAHWLQPAAQSGDAEAQYLLGRLFQKGWGVARDKSVAIMWYRRAANQGHREARKRLGGCRIC